jgi:RNase H-like domain found in reverse transcriptase/Reverse transcriptase (RNA-dependent DNA polymerase)/Integrase zinc binding domain
MTTLFDLERDYQKRLKNADKIQFVINLNPDADGDDDDSAKLFIAPFRSGDTEDVLHFVKTFRDLMDQKGLSNDAAALFRHAKLLIKDDARQVFDDEWDNHVNAAGERLISQAAFNACLDAVVKEYAPMQKPLQKFKQWFDKVRKPRDMTVRAFVRRLKDVNDYIRFLPTHPAKLSSEDLQAYVENAMPWEWTAELRKLPGYAEMEFREVEEYYKQLESLDKNKKSLKSDSSGYGGGSTRGDSALSDGGGRRIGRGRRRRNNNQGGNPGGPGDDRRGGGSQGRGNNDGGGGATRRSERSRGTYCPHCRTTAHDGSTCPLYQSYLRSRNNAGGEVHAMAQSTGSRASRNLDAHVIEPIDVSSDDDLDLESNSAEVFMVNDPDSDLKDDMSVGPTTHDYLNEDVSDIFVGAPSPLSNNFEIEERIARNPNYPPTPLGWPYSVEEWEVRYDEVRRPPQDPDTNLDRPRSVVEVRIGNGLQPNDPDFAERRLIGLLDSGSTVSIATLGVVPTECALEFLDRVRKHNTLGGVFVTHSKTELPIILPQFTVDRTVTCEFQIDETIGEQRAMGQYDFILGTDFLDLCGISLNFAERRIEWGELSIPMLMVPPKQSVREVFAAAKYIAADYHKYDLSAAVPDHLDQSEADRLESLLIEFQDIMKGGLGLLPGPPLDLELKPEARPFHLKPYPVPRADIPAVKAEADRMVTFGIWEETFDTPWASPSFAIKKKNGSVRIVTDFRRLNTMVVRYPYPLPRLADIFARLDRYTYASALDVSMGFYHVPLSEQAQKLCTTVLPWGKYRYKRMPMGLLISPDVFQHRMNVLFGNLSFVIIFIDDILIFTKGDFDAHLDHLRQVFQRLREADIQLNVYKCHFLTKEIPYLGFVLSPHGIRADPKKIAAIQKLAPPTNRTQVRSLLGMVNYLRELIPRHSQYTALLSDLVSNKAKFVWTKQHQDAFEKLKAHVARVTMLSFPDYALVFEIYTDASKRQIGSVIVQRNPDGSLRAPIAFFSRKMTPTQQRYTVMEQELLAIVETLRTYRNMLYGYPLVIFTDHKNLTFDRFASDRVNRWRLYVQEFCPTFKYLPGKSNLVADALSRLPMIDSDPTPTTSDALTMPVPGLPELFAFVGLSDDSRSCPIAYDVLVKAQLKEFPSSQRRLWKKQAFGPHKLCVDTDGRIFVPPSLRRPILLWYHDVLCHPGQARLAKTLQQTYSWPTLLSDVNKLTKVCDVCQRFKKTRPHYGILPFQEYDDQTPWRTVAVDLIGPWTVRARNRVIQFTALHCIDPASRWLELIRLRSGKDAETVALTFDRNWLCRYPRPLNCVFDQGPEFGSEFTQLLDSYGIARVPNKVKHPQANAILERSHQVVANMFRSFDFENTDLDPDDGPDDPLAGFVSAVAFAMRAAFHSSLQASPTQIVFGRDMFFPTRYVANWEAQRLRLQDRSRIDNERENRHRVPHEYKVGDKVLIRCDVRGEILGKLTRPSLGPFRITRLLPKGTVEIQRRGYKERINMRRLLPYFQDL